MKIAVIGPGAMGLLYGAKLSQCADVVLVGNNPEHIRENLDLFGFELSDEEMEQIATLDRGEKHDWY